MGVELARTLLALVAVSCGSSQTNHYQTSSAPACASLPPLAVKAGYTIGFAQVYEVPPAAWRAANTASILTEGNNRGDVILYQQGNDSTGVQESAQLQSFIDQKVDAIIMSAEDEVTFAPVVVAAREACIPVFIEDRGVDTTVAIPGVDYVTYIGSDFVGEGTKAANWLVSHFTTKMNIIELEGTVGSAAALGRKQGFDAVVANQSNMTILVSQSGDFNQTQGHDMTKQLVAQYPTVNVLFSHNDEMSFGAIAAIQELGLTPGKDITIVSIDGTKQGVQDILNGQIAAIVECNPFFGPPVFDQIANYAAGQTVPTAMLNVDQVFDVTNAAGYLPNAF